jgi:signal transduction histidine kinase
MDSEWRHDAGWRRLYRDDCDAILLSRVRWCVVLSLLGGVLQTLQAVLLWPPDVTARLVSCLATASVSVGAGVAAMLAPRRWATGLAVGYVLSLTASVTANVLELPQSSRDVASAGFVAITLGSTLLLPLGAVPQALVSAGTLLAYVLLLAVLPWHPDLGAICLVVSAAGVAVVGAKLIDRYRATSFQRTWQQEQLVSLARELATALEPADVLAKVLEHGLRLTGSDSGCVSLYDRDRGVMRVEACAGVGEMHSVAGLEVPADTAAVQHVLSRPMVHLPADNAASPLLEVARQYGNHHLLYVTMGHGTPDVLGIINFNRHADVPYGASELLVARGLCDHAALALRTARLVADLRRASRLKSEFVSTMSHELRTPLNVILGYADMARDAGAGETLRLECLERIDGAGRDLLSLIEGTLEIGRIEAGHEAPRLEPVALPAFWAVLGEACSRLPRKAGVALEWRSDVPDLTLETDPRKLTVVVRNLVGNALKFTERGAVLAEVEVEAEAVVLRVADTGIGIRPEDHEVIFDMFRQGDGSDSRRYGGTGLGLYIVRRFVAQLGGTIALDSAPGRGSVFTVRLPTSAAAGPSTGNLRAA